MMKIKKTLSLLLSLSLILGMIPVQTALADDVGFTKTVTDQESGIAVTMERSEPDEDGKLSIKLTMQLPKKNPILTAYSLGLQYDASFYEPDTGVTGVDTTGSGAARKNTSVKRENFESAASFMYNTFQVGQSSVVYVNGASPEGVNTYNDDAEEYNTPSITFYFKPATDAETAGGGEAKFRLFTGKDGNKDVFVLTIANYNVTTEQFDTGASILTLPEELSTTVVFPVGAVALTGNIVPKTGAAKTAKTISTDNDSVTATLAWTAGEFSTSSGTEVFKGSTAYTAKITLTPKAGVAFADEPTFTLTGLAGGTDLTFQKGTGADEGSYIATKTFAATAAAVLNSIATGGTLTKTDYVDGEAFAPAGLTVTAAYFDGTEREIAQKNDQDNGYEVVYARTAGDYADKLQKGDTKVTLSYTEGNVTKTADVAVSVAGKSVDAKTFKLNDSSLTYNKTNQLNAIKALLTPASDGVTISHTVSVRAAENSKEDLTNAVDAGTYYVFASVSDDAHYADMAATAIGSVTIAAKALAVAENAFSTATVVQGATSFSAPATLKDTVTNDDVAGTFKYRPHGANSEYVVWDAAANDFGKALAAVAANEEISFDWQFAPDAANYAATPVTGTVAVTAKTVEFKLGNDYAAGQEVSTANVATLNAAKQVYGNAWSDIATLQSDLSAWINTGTPRQLSGQFVIKEADTMPAAGKSNGFTVQFVASGDDAAFGTFDVATVTGVSIAPKELTLTWGELGSTYNGQAIAPTPTLSGYAGKESGLTVQLSYQAGKDSLDGAPKNAGTYTITPVLAAGEAGATAALSNYALSETAAAPVEWTISKKPVTVSGITAENKTYDGTAAATLVYTNAAIAGVVGQDKVTVSAAGAFADANAGASKQVTISNLALDGADAGNYTLAQSGQQTEAAAAIAAKEVTVSGITAEDKTWDGTTAATLVYTNATIAGVVGQDQVTVSAAGAFADANVAYSDGKVTAKKVTISNIALNGPAAGNYTLAAEGQQTETTATISKATIVPVIADIADQTYTGATILPEVTVTATINGAVSTLAKGTDYTIVSTANGDQVDNVNVSTGTKTGSVTITATSGNYDLANVGSETSTKTFRIVPKAISGVTIATIAAHTYDKTAYKPAPVVTDSAIKVQNADKTLIKDTDYTVSYSAAEPTDAGTYTVTITGAGNYTGTKTADFEIAQKGIRIASGITAVDKTYDGTTAAVLNVTNPGYDGVIESDKANLQITGAAGAFTDANVAYSDGKVAAKTVTITGLTLSGTAAKNYTLDAKESQKTAQAKINPKPVTVSGITAENKTYDGTAAATLVYTSAAIAGVVGQDKVTVSATGAFADANAGANKKVTISNLTLAGAAAGNYTLAAEGQQTETVAAISKAARSISANKSETITLYGAGEQETVTVTVSADLDSSAAAALTATSGNTAMAVVGAQGARQTLDGGAYSFAYAVTAGETIGQTSVTFALAATDNYEAATSPAVTFVVKAGYDVSVASGITNGCVTADRHAAKHHDTVTLTVKPNAGYTVGTVSYTPAGGEPIVLEPKDSVYSFGMPANDVSVSATFAKLSYGITDGSGAIATIAIDGSKQSAEYGETVEFTATPAQNTVLKSVWLIRTGDEQGASRMTLTPDSTGKYSFKMPANAVTIRAEAGTAHNVTTTLVSEATEQNHGSITGFSAKAVESAAVYFTATPSDGYTIGSVAVNVKDGEQTIKPSVDTKMESGAVVYSFSMPDADVELSATFVANITNEDLTNLTARGGEAAGETEVALEITVTDTTKTELENAAKAVEIPTEALTKAIGSSDDISNAAAAQEKDKAVAALAQAGLITVATDGENTTVTAGDNASPTISVVNKVFMDVAVTEYDEAASDSFRVSIEPKVQKVATVGSVDQNTALTEQNSVPMGGAKKIEGLKNILLTIGIPNSMAKKLAENPVGQTIYVKHNHNGTWYEYRPEIKGENNAYYVEFNNPYGFSEFELSLQSSSVASTVIGGETRYYTTFKDAVDAAVDATSAGNTVTIRMFKKPTSGDQTTVDKRITVMVAADENADYTVDQTDIKARLIPGVSVSMTSGDADVNQGKFVFTSLYIVTISGANSVKVGESIQLSLSVTDAGEHPAVGGKTVWSSSNEGVATVNSTGKVTGVSEGTATITATYTKDDVDYADTRVVTVTGTGSTGGGSVGGGGAAAVAGVSVASGITNGKLTVSNANAKAGDKVTVTATPNAGYAVGAVTAKDANGKTIEVAKNADGTYSFTIPKDAKLPVTVSATFAKAAAQFVDVAVGSFYEKAVEWAVGKGITNGKGAANTFKPNDTCTRAEAVTFLYRAAGEPNVTVTTRFKDVAAGSFYEKAVAWAVANGITNGKNANDTFVPNDTCTRAEIVAFLARFEKAAAADSSMFVDVSSSAWYAGSVGWAVKNGITNGKNAANTFVPNDTCTRAEIVTFLYRDFVK